MYLEMVSLGPKRPLIFLVSYASRSHSALYFCTCRSRVADRGMWIVLGDVLDPQKDRRVGRQSDDL